MNLRTLLVGVTVAVWGVAAQACEILDVRVCAIVNHVGADPNLSHRADRILSQGWKPTLRGSAVDKFSS
jgi:hypothetical protein